MISTTESFEAENIFLASSAYKGVTLRNINEINKIIRDLVFVFISPYTSWISNFLVAVELSSGHGAPVECPSASRIRDALKLLKNFY